MLRAAFKRVPGLLDTSGSALSTQKQEVDNSLSFRISKGTVHNVVCRFLDSVNIILSLDTRMKLLDRLLVRIFFTCSNKWVVTVESDGTDQQEWDNK